MENLKIDDKWTVEYDPENNDHPVTLFRHGERHALGPSTWNNDQIAMFYSLLESVGTVASLTAENEALHQQVAAFNGKKVG